MLLLLVELGPLLVQLVNFPKLGEFDFREEKGFLVEVEVHDIGVILPQILQSLIYFFTNNVCLETVERMRNVFTKLFENPLSFVYQFFIRYQGSPTN